MEDVSGLKDIAEDIKNMQLNHKSIKEQNSRLMTVNEKLLSESETLRKEIFRLRNLFGDDSYLATHRGGQMTQSLATDKSEMVSMLEQQISIFEIEVRKKNIENDSLKRRIQDLEDDLRRLKDENSSLREDFRKSLSESKDSQAGNFQLLLRENADLKAENDSIRNKLILADRELRNQSDNLHAKNQEQLN